ncbi:MAG: SsrA-binding protein [Flavobacteriaceae bacterium]|nr:SsrA-binding protein [Flavobacteriaceae bacterium]
MQKFFFIVIARINKLLFPSFSKHGLDLSKASKLQLAIIAWRAYVTKRAI